MGLQNSVRTHKFYSFRKTQARKCKRSCLIFFLLMFESTNKCIITWELFLLLLKSKESITFGKTDTIIQIGNCSYLFPAKFLYIRIVEKLLGVQSKFL